VKVSLPSESSDPIVLADWLEVLALTANDGNSSHGDLERVLNRLGVDDRDSLCRDAMNELNLRVCSAVDSYPFTFSGTLLRVREGWRSFTPYVFCLLLSYCDDSKKKVKGIKHTVIFEQLSCMAAKNYIGGEVLRFGAPRKELPSSFREALSTICVKVEEWSSSSTASTIRKQDGGLDLIAWKRFPDRRIGKLILFGHCASGQDWDGKINELQPGDFCSEWLAGEKSPIVKTFFVPHRLSDEMWAHRAISAKLFFDRCRIAHWVKNDEFCDGTGRENLKWCETVLGRLSS
jgi:hypothetical protein